MTVWRWVTALAGAAMAAGRSCKSLSHKHMDTLHCRLDVAGSAVQFNSSVSAMPPSPLRTFETPVHPGTADTLLLRYALKP
jgi:hypothetical protein